jgi:hypothetical protein
MRSSSGFLLAVGGLTAGLLGGWAASMLTSNIGYIRAFPTTVTDCVIMRVAERHIAVHYPAFDSIRNPPVVQYAGSAWHVFYILPQGTMGGTPHVTIDAGSLKVLSENHTQ